MLDHAADEEQAGIGQAGIAVTGKGVLALVPDRNMRVHTRTIVGLDRLGHEGCGLAIGLGNHLHDIFVDLDAVAGFDQLAEGQAQFVLAAGDFMVMLVHGQAHFHQRGHHFGANVGGHVDRADREIAALGAGTVTHIAAVIFRAAVGGQFDIVQLVEAGIVGVVEFDAVEHEEFRFRADIDGVTKARRLEEHFRALGGRTRIARIERTIFGFDDVAHQDHHRRRAERIEEYRVQIGLQDHVRFVDFLPALDRGAVEHQAVSQLIFANDVRAHRQVVPGALGIGKTDIDPLDLLFLDHLENVFWRIGHVRLPFSFITPPKG